MSHIMYKIAYVFAIICFVSSVKVGSTRSTHHIHDEASLEIIGGDVVKPHSLPEVVSLVVRRYDKVSKKWHHDKCGATLLSHNYVLTAAHCVRRHRGIIAMIGVHNISDIETGGQYIRAKRITPHPSYNATTNENDIAILKLAESANYTNQSDAVRLPTWSDVNKTYVGEDATVAGWGRTTNDGNSSALLRSATYPIMDLADCKSQMLQFGLTVPDEDICAASKDADGKIRSSCTGDSGGPVFVGTNRTQIGIVSFGSTGGCEAGDPDVLVKVTNYLRWIEENSDVKIAD